MVRLRVGESTAAGLLNWGVKLPTAWRLPCIICVLLIGLGPWSIILMRKVKLRLTSGVVSPGALPRTAFLCTFCFINSAPNTGTGPRPPPAPGPLHLLIPLCAMFFPQYQYMPHSLTPSGLCFSLAFSVRPSLANSLKRAPDPRPRHHRPAFSLLFGALLSLCA